MLYRAIRGVSHTYAPVLRRSMLLGSSELRSLGSKSGSETEVLEPGFHAEYAKQRTKKLQSPAASDMDSSELPRVITEYKLSAPKEGDHFMPHPLFDKDGVERIAISHVKPTQIGDHVALWVMRMARSGFDAVTGYPHGMNQKKYLNRVVFLESVAGVPGMVGGMLRHLKSLRRGLRDRGRIVTLLDEAQNERIHLLWSLELHPTDSWLKRFLILGAQGVAVNAYFLSYLFFPRACHRFVGYLEEEAVRTYTGLLEAIDAEEADLGEWKTKPAGELAKRYWALPEDATVRDVFAAIRADEAVHRQVNHVYAEIPDDAPNPF